MPRAEEAEEGEAAALALAFELAVDDDAAPAAAVGEGAGLPEASEPPLEDGFLLSRLRSQLMATSARGHARR